MTTNEEQPKKELKLVPYWTLIIELDGLKPTGAVYRRIRRLMTNNDKSERVDTRKKRGYSEEDSSKEGDSGVKIQEGVIMARSESIIRYLYDYFNDEIFPVLVAKNEAERKQALEDGLEDVPPIRKPVVYIGRTELEEGYQASDKQKQFSRYLSKKYSKGGRPAKPVMHVFTCMECLHYGSMVVSEVETCPRCKSVCNVSSKGWPTSWYDDNRSIFNLWASSRSHHNHSVIELAPISVDGGSHAELISAEDISFNHIDEDLQAAFERIKDSPDIMALVDRMEERGDRHTAVYLLDHLLIGLSWHDETRQLKARMRGYMAVVGHFGKALDSRKIRLVRRRNRIDYLDMATTMPDEEMIKIIEAYG